MQEEYVRRLASSTEVDEILRNPKLVEAARRKMQEGFEEAGKELGSG